ncbi:MAG: glycosyltransferase family 2 protein [Bacteroidales bacterium]|nr:glycosyltransferase family 2 protein [Bacteroidales bacterium]
MQNNKVFIIVINFGTPEHTIECLESIHENSYDTYQTVVVDISNLNQSVSKLSKWMKEKNDKRFYLIREEKNKGFAFANNIGMKYALGQDDCDFLWILNNDTIIERNSLEALISCHLEKSKPGFTGSKILDYENPEIIQNIGGTFNKWTGYSVLVGMGRKDSGQFDKQQLEVDYVVGASMLCHKSLIRQIGFMPEDYFLYYEDIDWCTSAQQAGFKNYSCANSRVYHKQGISTGSKLLTGDNHLQNKKYLYRSYLTFYRRHFKHFLPIAYLILLKQMVGKLFHLETNEAGIIARVVFQKAPH